MNNSQSDSEISESLDADADDSQSSTSSSSSSSCSTLSRPLTNNTETQSDDEDVEDDEDEGENDNDDEFQSGDTLELAEINKSLLRLPRALCESKQVFYEFFSPATWVMLPADLQLTLGSLLPTFTDLLDVDEAAAEVDRTLNMLLNNELCRFGSTPLSRVQEQLEAGNYRPDVVKLRKSIAKSKRREQRFLACERISQLARDIFVQRERLLRSAYKCAPDEQLPAANTGTPVGARKHMAFLCSDTKLYVVRARHRYSQELGRLVQQVGLKSDMLRTPNSDNDSVNEADEGHHSADSEDIDSWSTNIFKTSTSSGGNPMDKCIYGTLFKRQYNLTDEESLLAQRNAKQARLTHKNFRKYLMAHKRRKLTEPNLPEYEIADIRLRDVCTRAQMGFNFKRIFASLKTTGRKPKYTASVMATSFKCKNPPIAVTNERLDDIDVKNHGVSETSDQLSYNNDNNKSVPDSFVPQTQDIYHGNDIINNDCEDENAIVHGFDLLDGEVELQQEEVVATYNNDEVDDVDNHHHHNHYVNNYMQQQQPQNVMLDNPSITATPTTTTTTMSTIVATTEINELTTNTQTTINSNYNTNNNLSTLGLTVLPKLEPLPQQKHQNNSNNNSSGSSFNQTHACFFSLVRDLFCATTHHRMQLQELTAKVENWLLQPLSTLNSWYTLLDNWSVQLTSAIEFLTGEFMQLPDEYVPYLEYKSQTNIYQWIGAGRDSDVRLSTLCGYWLQKRQPNLTPAVHFKATSPTRIQTPIVTIATSTPPTAIPVITTTPNTSAESPMKSISTPTMSATTSPENTSPRDSMDNIGANDNIPPDPVARCPTNWTVRTATPQEILDFQVQERERFENPHKAYTYRMHGYESVVGPVKGIYSQIYALTKARGHSMMVGDRPNFVTILTLVRDAVSRLPNGEGTRADISELVKSSQYLNHNAAENVLQTIVSGALDRMHTEIDPCVRYDSKRKIWIYLHRNRGEEEFERIHQQQQGVGRHRKPTNRKSNCKKSQSNSTSPITTTTMATAVSPILQQNAISPPTGSGGILVTTLSQPPPLTSVTDSQLSNSPPSAAVASTVSTLLPLPALVPANSLIISNQQKQPQLIKQKQQILLKCPPVPPLKYHVSPHLSAVQQQQQQQQTQQQKSLLKTARIVGSTPTTAPTPTTSSSSGDNQRILVRTISSNNNDVSHADNPNNKKQIQQQSPFTRTFFPSSSGATKISANTKSPILLATPTSLQQLQTVGTSTTTTQLSGKRLAINRPIIINQNDNSNNSNNIPQQQIVYSNNKNNNNNSNRIIKQQSPQIQVNNQVIFKQQQTHQQHQQQTTQSFIIPFNDATDQPQQQQQQTSNVQAMFLDNGQLTTLQQTQQPKNIIRWVPAGNQIQHQQPQQQQQQQHNVGQQKKVSPIQILRTQKTTQQQQTLGGTSSAPSSTTKSSNTPTNIGGISIITSGAATGVGGNTFVKMTPQAFAALQQHQQLGKSSQHITIIKSGVSGGASTTTTTLSPQQQQRVILTGQGQSKQQQHNVVHTLPPIVASASASSSSPSVVTISPSTNATNIISPTSQHVKKGFGGNTVQTITATSLSPQQQRILLQNLKHQKQQQQQSPQQQNKQYTTKPTHILSSPLQQNKQHVQTLTRFIKASPSPSSSLSSVGAGGNDQTTAMVSTTPTTRLLTSGNVISLEELMQKQRGASSTSQSTTMSMPQIVTLTNSSQQQQQQQQQYGVVVSPNSRGIISIGGNTITTSTATTTTGLGTIGQRLISTSAVGGNNYILTQKSGTTTPVTKLISSSDGSSKPTTTTAQQSNAIKTLTSGSRVISMSGVASNNNSNRVNTTNNIRIINTSNTGVGGVNSLNFANLQGKQVVFATKQQQQQLQNAGMVIGGQTVKLQANLNKNSLVPQTVTSSGGQQLQTVIVGNQILRVQQLTRSNSQQAINKNVNATGATNRLTFPLNKVGTAAGTSSASISNDSSSSSNTSKERDGNSANFAKTLVLSSGAKTIQLQTAPKMASVKSFVSTTQNSNVGTSTGTGNRLVLAMQSGQPFILPAGSFQGGTINLKSLQNMKLVSLGTAAGQGQSATTISVKEQSTVPQSQASMQ